MSARGERSFIARVVRKSAVADGVVGLRLEDADGRDLPIWEPGAHVDLVIEREPRQYSLCGDVNDRAAYATSLTRSGKW
jgi:ferredoxin-NADP reductase